MQILPVAIYRELVHNIRERQVLLNIYAYIHFLALDINGISNAGHIVFAWLWHSVTSNISTTVKKKNPFAR